MRDVADARGSAEFRHAQGQIPVLASFEAKAEASGAAHKIGPVDAKMTDHVLGTGTVPGSSSHDRSCQSACSYLISLEVPVLIYTPTWTSIEFATSRRPGTPNHSKARGSLPPLCRAYGPAFTR